MRLKLYNPRHPERTLLYQTVAEPYVRQAFAKYLAYGIFAHGFAPPAGAP